jgi:hypothetical protein
VKSSNAKPLVGVNEELDLQVSVESSQGLLSALRKQGLSFKTVKNDGTLTFSFQSLDDLNRAKILVTAPENTPLNTVDEGPAPREASEVPQVKNKFSIKKIFATIFYLYIVTYVCWGVYGFIKKYVPAFQHAFELVGKPIGLLTLSLVSASVVTSLFKHRSLKWSILLSEIVNNSSFALTLLLKMVISDKSATSVTEGWESKRQRGSRVTCHSVSVKGGPLPKSGSIGQINVRYDGSFPRQYRSTGNIRYYKTSGNLQVFYPKSFREHDRYVFEGNIVDIYFV